MHERCQKCGQPATYKFTKIVKGKPADAYYCEEHAQEASPYVPQSPGPEMLAKWLKGVVEGAGGPGPAPERADIPDVRCGSCGLAFEAYRRTLLLGCPDCYASFEEHLIPDLRKFHGEIRHIGRSPAGVRGSQPEAADFHGKKPAAGPVSPAAPSEPPDQDELRRRLKAAVQSEDFEEAAKIRDRIRVLERKQSA